jgi:hypothetical protein
MRRSLSAIEELHKEIEKQYKAGMNIIKSDQNSRRLFEQLIKECPNVPEADVVRAFATPNIGTKNVEAATIAAAHDLLVAIACTRAPRKLVVIGPGR